MTATRRTTCAATLLLALWSHQALAGEREPIYAFPKRATKQRIVEFVKGGMVWEWGVPSRWRVTFPASGKVELTSIEGKREVACPADHLVVEDGLIQFDYTCACPTESASQPCQRTQTARFDVKLVSPEVIVVDAGHLASGSHSSLLVLSQCQRFGALRHCMSGRDPTLVELMPGNRDQALHQQVVKWVGRNISGYKAMDPAFPYYFFQAPLAQTPREESQIFYANTEDQAGRADDRNARTAQTLADLLEPIIGPVSPEPWPGGKWDFDVVVVVGSRPAPQENAGPRGVEQP